MISIIDMIFLNIEQSHLPSLFNYSHLPINTFNIL